MEWSDLGLGDGYDGMSTSSKLVDIINSIWNVASNVVTIIKEAATNVLNAVKDGFNYLSNSVLSAIYGAIEFTGDKLIQTLFILMASLFSDITSSTNNGVSSLTKDGNSFSLDLASFSNGLDLDINGEKIRLTDIFSNSIQLETLAVSASDFQDQLNGIIIGEIINLVTTVLARLLISQMKLNAATILLFGSILVTNGIYIKRAQDFKSQSGPDVAYYNKVLDTLAIFNLGMAMGVPVNVFNK